MKRRVFLQAVMTAAGAAGLIRRRPPVNAPTNTRARGGVRCVWQQNVSGDWNDPRNWLNGRVPRDGDSVHVPAGTIATMPNDAPSIHTLTVEGAFITPRHPGGIRPSYFGGCGMIVGGEFTLPALPDCGIITPDAWIPSV